MEETVWVTPYFNMSQAMWYTMVVSVVLVVLATAAVRQLYRAHKEPREAQGNTIEFTTPKYVEPELSRELLILQLLAVLEQQRTALLEESSGELAL